MAVSRRGRVSVEAGTECWPRESDHSGALRTMFTGEDQTSAEAAEKGIFGEIHPPDELEDAVFEFAEMIVQKPAGAVGHNKLAVNEGLELPLWDALAHERELQNQLLGSDIAKEGVDAFLNKREPDFLGVELGDKDPGSDD